MNNNSNKKSVFIISTVLIIIAVLAGIYFSGANQQKQTKQNEVHVAVNGNDESGKGTQDSPFATVSTAAEEAPGSIIFLHEGEYSPIKLGSECSGSEKFPTIIRPAEGEKAVIQAGGGTGISINNVSYITIEGLEIEGGTHGIDY